MISLFFSLFLILKKIVYFKQESRIFSPTVGVSRKKSKNNWTWKTKQISPNNLYFLRFFFLFFPFEIKIPYKNLFCHKFLHFDWFFFLFFLLSSHKKVMLFLYYFYNYTFFKTHLKLKSKNKQQYIYLFVSNWFIRSILSA